MIKAVNYPRLKQLQQTLHHHKIYDAVKSQTNMKIFMENHVFAVWDFMLLLKELQRKLTNVNKIWTPPNCSNTARFINEIVVGQQTDVHPSGSGHISHFELYLQSMKEVGASTQVIQDFISNLLKGQQIQQSIRDPRIPSFVQDFVLNTWSSLDRSTPYVAAQFFYGREDPIPQMFQKFVNTIEGNKKCDSLKYYLVRHIQVDGQEHGPLSEQLMENLAKRQDPEYQQIMEGAINAVTYRIKLWDGIYSKLVL